MEGEHTEKIYLKGGERGEEGDQKGKVKNINLRDSKFSNAKIREKLLRKSYDVRLYLPEGGRVLKDGVSPEIEGAQLRMLTTRKRLQPLRRAHQQYDPRTRKKRKKGGENSKNSIRAEYYLMRMSRASSGGEA